MLLGIRKCEQAASIKSQYGVSKIIGHSSEFDVSVMGDIRGIYLVRENRVPISESWLFVVVVVMAIVMVITVVFVGIVVVIIIIIIIIMIGDHDCKFRKKQVSDSSLQVVVCKIFQYLQNIVSISIYIIVSLLICHRLNSKMPLLILSGS